MPFRCLDRSRAASRQAESFRAPSAPLPRIARRRGCFSEPTSRMSSLMLFGRGAGQRHRWISLTSSASPVIRNRPQENPFLVAPASSLASRAAVCPIRILGHFPGGKNHFRNSRPAGGRLRSARGPSRRFYSPGPTLARLRPGPTPVRVSPSTRERSPQQGRGRPGRPPTSVKLERRGAGAVWYGRRLAAASRRACPGSNRGMVRRRRGVSLSWSSPPAPSCRSRTAP
jgi:hypothetical protein